jgi:predicted nucleic acid-binding protein
VILCDTGPLVAAGNKADSDFHSCTELFTGLHLAGRRILIPGTVVAETGYLLATRGGAQIEAAFLTAVAEGSFELVALQPSDFARMAELVLTYSNFPLGTTDASVIALAERLGITEVATLDHRHFRAVRPHHVGTLTLLP